MFCRRKWISLYGVIVIVASAPLIADAEPSRPSPQRGVALVLSGGGARGCAHIGVLRVLEELRVPVGAVAGTSMGAVVGGAYATGLTPDEVQEQLVSIDWENVLRDKPAYRDLGLRRKHDYGRYLFDFEAGLRNGRLVLASGLISGQKLSLILERLTLNAADIEDFDKLPVPFRAVAVDLISGREIVLKSGRLSTAIRASMAIPGVVAPVKLQDYMLIDGGVLDNIPVDVGRSMGLESVIAVDASTPPLVREELSSVFAVLQQTMTLAAQQNGERQTAEADVLIRVKPGIANSDVDGCATAIAAGESAARAAAGDLQHYAVSEDEFAIFQRQRHPGADPTPGIVGSIAVEGSARVDQRRILKRIETAQGRPLSMDTVERDVARIFSIGEFELVDFALTGGETTRKAMFRLHDKPVGPNYVRFGLTASNDFIGDKKLDLLVNLTRTGLNALGGEWRNELSAGDTRRAYSELFQPLDFGGRYFLAASADATQTRSSVYDDGQKVSEYVVNQFVAAADLGYQITSIGEARIGVMRGRTRAEVDVGAPSLPSSNVDTGGLRASLTLDGRDSPTFPRDGSVVGLDSFRSVSSLGGEEVYSRVSAIAGVYRSIGRHDFFANWSAGFNPGGDLPVYDDFLVGGLFSLSGFSPGELRGTSYQVFRIGYTNRIFTLPPGLGSGVYAGMWLESGDVDTRRETTGLEDPEGRITTGTIALGVDSRVGPIHLAYGYASGGSRRVYLTVGRSF